MNQYYTTMEIAKMLKVSHITIYRWIYKGELKVIKLNKDYRISDKDIEDFINNHQVKK